MTVVCVIFRWMPCRTDDDLRKLKLSFAFCIEKQILVFCFLGRGTLSIFKGRKAQFLTLAEEF